MIGSGLALLGIVVMIGIVAEDCEGFTMSTVDHFPPINAGWPVAKLKTLVMAPFCSAKKRYEGTSNTTPASQPAFMGGADAYGPR